MCDMLVTMAWQKSELMEHSQKQRNNTVAMIDIWELLV